MTQPSELEIVTAAIEQARCPECGDQVFIPAMRTPFDNPTDPEVWCREFGHWAGKLSDCQLSCDFVLDYFDDESFVSKLDLLSKIEAAFDDARNEMPTLWYYFSDLVPVGKKVKITVELTG